jgi:hypothetical protein
MKKLNINIPYAENFTGDKKIVEKIVLYIWEQGWTISSFGETQGVRHVGNNKYEIPLTLSDAPLAGMGGMGLFWLNGDDEVKMKFKTTWMS